MSAKDYQLFIMALQIYKLNKVKKAGPVYVKTKVR
jgi:hypothetical protein